MEYKIALAPDALFYPRINWCLDQFGVDSRDSWTFDLDRREFYFRDPQQFTLFVLRWS